MPEDAHMVVKMFQENMLVRCKTDELIYYTGSMPVTGNAVASIELKKDVEMKHVSQSTVELLTYGRLSSYPLVHVSLTISILTVSWTALCRY